MKTEHRLEARLTRDCVTALSQALALFHVLCCVNATRFNSHRLLTVYHYIDIDRRTAFVIHNTHSVSADEI